MPTRRVVLPLILLAACGTLRLAAMPPELLQRGLSRACRVAYYPSLNRVYVQFDFGRRNVRLREIAALGESVREVRVQVFQQGRDEALAETVVPVADAVSADQAIDLPPLDGQYEVRCHIQAGGRDYTVNVPFERRHFAWEGNTLGLTDEVFPPFTPVRADGPTVRVVDRTYTLNGHGLFTSVVSAGAEVLAAPMTIRYLDAAGTEQMLPAGTVRLVERTDQAATYTAHTAAPPVAVDATCTVEFDGMMRVQLTLAPGARPAPIGKLWLDLPVRTAEARLFHEYVDGPRINEAGSLPAGEGVIWDSTKARRYGAWSNSFCPYLWVGRLARGLAWFAENDRGWLTEKGGSKTPIQEIRRDGDRVTIRVYLVNHTVTLAAPHELVFGLQASPTKPMPENWRAEAWTKPGMSGPVSPWGGLHCAYKGPYRDDWQVVDTILQARDDGKYDKQFLEDFNAKYKPPPIYGTWPWLESVTHFAGSVARAGNRRAILVYHEEMGASVIVPDWQTFQDEWGTVNYTQRQWADESLLWKGFNANPGSHVTFPTSYQEYGLHYANEWLKRGVGLYWDNTYPKAVLDTRMTNAYVDATGAIQPALAIWAQRAYQKRVWNLLQEWRRKSEYPLEWSLHMTNSMILPVQTFGTTHLDLEWGWQEPFPPALIRTETMGRQVGNYPKICHQLYGRGAYFRDLPRYRCEEVEWGLRRVHELDCGGPENYRIRPSQYERMLYEFGYGRPDLAYHEYWADEALLTCDNDAVKWFAVARPEQRDLLLIVASWSQDPATCTLTVDPTRLGFPVPPVATDLRTLATIPVQDNALTLNVTVPYGNRVVRFSAAPLPETEGMFTDGFDAGPSLRWDYVSPFVRNVDGAMRFAVNEARWQGPSRLEYWPTEHPDVAPWTDYELSFRLRFAQVPPPGDVELFAIRWRGEPTWSKHGLSHTSLRGGPEARFGFDKEGRLRLHVLEVQQRGRAEPDWHPAPDTAWHTVTIRAVGDHHRISWDGDTLWEGDAALAPAGGFALLALTDNDSVGHVDVDDIRVRAVQ